MRKILLAFIFITGIHSAMADTWTQKASLSYTIVRAASFSIGDSGYICTGATGSSKLNALWKYDPGMDTWTQKADCGGPARMDAVGFSIGNKGYVGTGWNGTTLFSDFWEYDPADNSWTSKSPFPGGARQSAIGFGLGTKGYIGGGVNSGFIFFADFWEYDPVSGFWINRTDIPNATAKGTAFSSGNYGYLGLGENDNGNLKTFYQYDPSSHNWTSLADFGGAAVEGASGFSIGSYGYIGTGYASSNRSDFWQYDVVADTWAQVTSLPASARSNAVGFNIGNKGYIGTGTPGLSDFWEYRPDPLSVKERSIAGVSIYPNLVRDQFTVRNEKIENKPVLIIYNMLGERVLCPAFQNGSSKEETVFDATGLGKGLYIVVLQNSYDIAGNGSTLHTARFIKE